jgi:histone-lysine N-methyltransferase ASH1L
LTFVRDDVQFAIGDCVYVMRDCKRTSNGTPLRSSNSPKASVNPDMLDVFRLHQLWKDSKGRKFASGTPYLRPQETFHEPTRKFYHNELFRTPNFEIVPMDLVAGKCVVMDPGTYVKGRPKGVREQDIYICEFRVDKTAHLFYKIPKIWYPINTSRFCFDWYEDRLAIKRTYLPHKVPDVYKRKTDRSAAAATPPKQETLKEKLSTKKVSSLAGVVKVDETIKNDIKLKSVVKVHVVKEGLREGPKEKDQAPKHRLKDGPKEKYQAPKHGLKDGPKEKDKVHKHVIKSSKNKVKNQRLDRILTRLLDSLPGKQRVDLSYLLDETKRVQKKVTK